MPKPKADKDFLERVKRHAPELVNAQVDFDKVVTHILHADPDRTFAHFRRKRRITKQKRKK